MEEKNDIIILTKEESISFVLPPEASLCEVRKIR